MIQWLMNYASRNKPDFVIGDPANPYLLRWYLTPWRRWLSAYHRATGWRKWLLWPANLLPNVYLHKFCRPDEDRALHDHPFAYASRILVGSYIEHTIKEGGIHCRKVRNAGSWAFRRAKSAHRVELFRVGELISDTWEEKEPPEYWSCWTLFIIGPRVRDWGFHCKSGWVPWQEFTKAENPGEVGKGCGES